MMRVFNYLTIGGSFAIALQASAAPGELDLTFSPVLRNEITPGSVAVAPDGKILLGGSWEGFDRIDGTPVGDRVLLDTDGILSSEPLPGLLEPFGNGILLNGLPIGGRRDWFALDAGEWLVPGGADGWLKREASGAVSSFFTGVAASQKIHPQFVEGQRLWVIRVAGGQRIAEVRSRVDGTLDPSFQPSVNWPAQPLQLVPADAGGAWVMGGDSPVPVVISWPYPNKSNVIFRVSSAGAWDETILVRQVNHYVSPELSASSGGYRLLSGRDRRVALLWPQSSMERRRIGWHDGSGGLFKEMQFDIPFNRKFVWAEDASGHLLATGTDGRLRRFSSSGTIDLSFPSPGTAASIIALPDEKWLVDGRRRLLADGQPDPAWHVPELTAPGRVQSIQPLEDGRSLVTGRFHSFQGVSVRDLAMVNGDGSVDSSFAADPRAAFPISAVSSGGFVYVVTLEAVSLSGGRFSNLLKLDSTGALDESFDAETGTQLWGSLFTQVIARTGGGIVAVKRNVSDVSMETAFYLDATGGVQAKLPSSISWLGSKLVALPDGGCVLGSVIYGPGGAKVRSLGTSADLNPLCEWQGGILFTEAIGGGGGLQRLRLWRGGRWAAEFAASPIRSNPGILHATEGEQGTLYLAAAWDSEDQGMRRMLSDGSDDETFVAPEWKFRVRRDAGPWKIAGTAGVESLDPSTLDRPVTPSRWAYHPGSAKLWVGGSFNLVDGVPRDGIARLDTGEVPPLTGQPRTAYESWELGMGLTESGADGDDDGDGVTNALEFLFGTDPRQPSEATRIALVDGEGVFSYPVSLEAVDSDHGVEFSANLVDWETADESNAVLTATPEAGDVTRILVSVPDAGTDRLFFRLRAVVR